MGRMERDLDSTVALSGPEAGWGYGFSCPLPVVSLGAEGQFVFTGPSDRLVGGHRARKIWVRFYRQGLV